MNITHLSCHFNNKEQCHDLIITTDKGKHHYCLESAMVYDFGIIQAVRAIVNLIHGLSDLFPYGRTYKAAQDEIELLEKVIEFLVQRKNQ